MTTTDNKIVEIFIPGPAGRLEAKYYKSKKNTSPIALVLHPHPQYGGTTVSYTHLRAHET